jgi:hypothetical protein
MKELWTKQNTTIERDEINQLYKGNVVEDGLIEIWDFENVETDGGETESVMRSDNGGTSEGIDKSELILSLLEYLLEYMKEIVSKEL